MCIRDRSHTCPRKYEPVEHFMPGIDQSKVDKSTENWLDTIEDRLDYKEWYCGHWQDVYKRQCIYIHSF